MNLMSIMCTNLCTSALPKNSEKKRQSEFIFRELTHKCKISGILSLILLLFTIKAGGKYVQGFIFLNKLVSGKGNFEISEIFLYQILSFCLLFILH